MALRLAAAAWIRALQGHQVGIGPAFSALQPVHSSKQVAPLSTSAIACAVKKYRIKPYSSYKERFRVTGSGLISYWRPGHRHKRFAKSSKQNRQLRSTKVMHGTYAKVLKKLGFN